MKLNRRQFMGISTLMAGSALAAANPVDTEAPGRGDVLAEALRYRKIDAHGHADFKAITVKMVLESCDRLGIERTTLSLPRGLTPEEFRWSNKQVLKALREHPDRLIGQCFVNPQFEAESLEELKRCLGEGFAGLGELYSHVKINDPRYYPLIETCIEEKASILMHARADTSLLRGVVTEDPPPDTSVPNDFVDVARRYPEALLIHGHIGGGGDWEYMCKALRDSPSVYVDTSGSVADEGMIDFAVGQLGVERLLFATDTNFETGVGKILDAKLTEAQRKQIFHGNFNGILRKRGLHAD